jgi:hypothetical protein
MRSCLIVPSTEYAMPVFRSKTRVPPTAFRSSAMLFFCEAGAIKLLERAPLPHAVSIGVATAIVQGRQEIDYEMTFLHLQLNVQ